MRAYCLYGNTRTQTNMIKIPVPRWSYQVILWLWRRLSASSGSAKRKTVTRVPGHNLGGRWCSLRILHRDISMTFLAIVLFSNIVLTGLEQQGMHHL